MADAFDYEGFARRMGGHAEAMAKRLRDQADEASRRLHEESDRFVRDLFNLPQPDAPKEPKPADQPPPAG